VGSPKQYSIDRDSGLKTEAPELPLGLREDDVLALLERRLGSQHARQRLGIERDHDVRIFGDGINFFHPENWDAFQVGLTFLLRTTGLYRRGRRNAKDIQLKHNLIRSPALPAAFDGFTILHLSDLHADTNTEAMAAMKRLVCNLSYNVCVLTGDYRGATYGAYDAVLARLEDIRAHLQGDAYAVLGNHDTILMVPGMEAMGYRILLNESTAIERDGQQIHLVGVDDAHYFRADNIEKAAGHIPHTEFSILLSHTPEIYRQAAHAGFDIMLSGHTHGGQICLPGGIPLTLDSTLPRYMGAGAWKYGNMVAYTSVGAGTSIVPVRLNCPPEITLHELKRS
jgi:predicted MPP superfamily phosphohydrolase